MRILSLALTAMLFSPFAAQAETVFNDAGAFQTALTMKLGYENGANNTFATQSLDNEGSAGALGGVAQLRCQSNEFRAISASHAGGYVCVSCPTGADCDGSEFSCRAGYHYQYGSNGLHDPESKCIICPAGTYQDRTHQAACNNTPAGSCASTTGTSCIGGSNTGATTKYACPAGKFQKDQNKTTCDDCAAGSYTGSSGKTSCTACPEGTYQGSTGKTSCTDVGKGYCASTNGTSCIGAGKTGATTTYACQSGKYQGSTKKSTCDTCAAGSYSGSGAQTSCTACGAGKYQASSGKSSCDSAGAGYCASKNGSCVSSGATERTQCAKHTHSNANQTACDACAADEYAPPGSASCTKIADKTTCASGYTKKALGDVTYCAEEWN